MNEPGAFAHVLAILPLLGAAAGWYIASRLSVEALAGGRAAPLRRGAGQCITILIVALIAIIRHEPQIAIGVVFGSCVATLSLVLGVVTFTAPPNNITIEARSKWGFVLPATVLVFLAGYQSQFTLLHALVLAIEGIVIWLVWAEFPRFAEVAPSGAVPDVSTKPKPLWLAPLWITLAVAIALIAGWVAVSAAVKVLNQSSLPSLSIIAALLLGPALVIPMIGTSSLLSQRGQYTDAVSAQVATVLFNLCVILPIVIVVWYLAPALPAKNFHELTQRLLNVQTESPLNFPLIVWRVDSVMLILLGLMLVPISLGRWLPGKPEGIMLILLYAAYMVLWRWGSSM